MHHRFSAECIVSLYKVSATPQVGVLREGVK